MTPGLVALTQGDPMNIARTVLTHLYEVDPNQPAGKIQSLEQVRAESIAAPRLTTNLLGLFALLALAIAAAGIGGVMALSVSQRIHEIGVRMAVGARPVEIVAMILRQGMGLALDRCRARSGSRVRVDAVGAQLPVRSDPDRSAHIHRRRSGIDGGRVRCVLHPSSPCSASRSVAGAPRRIVFYQCADCCSSSAMCSFQIAAKVCVPWP